MVYNLTGCMVLFFQQKRYEIRR